MLDLLVTNPLAFLIVIVGLIFSITIHEFSHAFIADKLGDPTPRYQGRVTLNPLAHLDPIGSIAMILTGFGWGKPVQFDPYNLKEVVRDTALISLAGPASNMIAACVLALFYHLVPSSLDWLQLVLGTIVTINLSLAIFNLIPVYPLDGSKIVLVFLPKATAYEYEQFMQRYGFLILLVLIFPILGGMSPISYLISPVINSLSQLLLGTF